MPTRIYSNNEFMCPPPFFKAGLQVITGNRIADEDYKHDHRDHDNQNINHTNPPSRNAIKKTD